jgi:inorganic pyrophosphatase
MIRRFMYCVFETRKRFPFKNYGEIPKTYNPADGDPWDVFAPGYHVEIPRGKKYKIMKIIGVYCLDNGNHKVAVRVHYPGFDPVWVNEDIRRSCKGYTLKTGVRGFYVPIE